MNVEQVELYVKAMLISSYFNTFYYHLPPDEFTDILDRIFKQKKKVIMNLARYVQQEIERGHPLEKVLQNLSFFAVVLKDFVSKNQNQPLIK